MLCTTGTHGTHAYQQKHHRALFTEVELCVSVTATVGLNLPGNLYFSGPFTCFPKVHLLIHRVSVVLIPGSYVPIQDARKEDAVHVLVYCGKVR